MKNNINKEDNILFFSQPGEFYQRRAVKHMERQNYFDAIGFFRKAIEADPKNAQYRLELAEMYTEMGYFDESNNMLLMLMQENHEFISDCIFAIGCNYMGMQDFSKSEEAFEKYLSVNPRGEFYQEAEDYLDIIRIQGSIEEEEELIENIDMAAYNLGKECIDQGDYEQAIKVFSKLVEQEESKAFVKNNLALAYYCNKDIDLAIQITQEVLEEYPDNLHANCNLAIFAHDLEKHDLAEQVIDTIKKLTPSDPEDIHKVCVTYCELSMHRDAINMLKQLLLFYSYDKKVLHYYAVANFNLGQYVIAFEHWNKIIKIDPNNTVAIYYRELCKQYINLEMPKRELTYHYQVPFEEIIRRIKYLNDCVRLSSDELRRYWNNDFEFNSIIRWGLDINDVIIKKAVLNLVASFKDQKAIDLLGQFILKRTESDEIKQEVFLILNQIGAPEPYVAYIEHDIVEVFINDKLGFERTLPPAFSKVKQVIKERMLSRRSRDLVEQASMIWHEYIILCAPDFHTIRYVDAWAAAVEYICCIRNEKKVSKTELCRIYEIRMSVLNRSIARINEKLKEKDSETD